MPRPRRPVPSDYAQIAPQMSRKELKKHYKVGDTCLGHWMEATGIHPRWQTAFTLPDNIEELAAGRNLSELAAVLGWSWTATAMHIKRALPELYAEMSWRGMTASADELRRHHGPGAPVPDDFMTQCQMMTRAALSKHYRRSNDTITRWIAESGEACRKLVDSNSERRRREGGINCAKLNMRSKNGMRLPKTVTAIASAQTIPVSRADQAMRWLQRQGRCFPAAYSDYPHMGGYFFNGLHYTADALIEEAKRRGWEPDAWRQVAA